MRLTKPRHVSSLIALVPVFVFLVVPTLIVLPVAFTGSRYITFPPGQLSTDAVTGFFRDQAWMAALSASLQAAGVAVAIAVAIGGRQPWRCTGVRFPGRRR